MKLMKRTVSVFLAILMLFGSFSVLTSAAVVDGYGDTITFDVKFYRNTGTADSPVWTETTKAAPGESIRARFFIDTDFVVGSSEIFFLYNKNALEMDPTLYVKPSNSYTIVSNTTPGSVAADNNITGAFTFSTEQTGVGDDLVYYENLPEDTFDTYGFAYFAFNNGKASKWSGDNWLFELHYTVAETPTENAQIHMPIETVITATDEYNNWDAAATRFGRLPETSAGGSMAGKGYEESYDWDPVVINADQDADSTLTFKNSITFKTGDGTFEGGEKEVTTTGFINSTATIPNLVAPAGSEFLGWVPADKELTEDNIVTNITYGYEDAVVTYNALYKTTEAPTSAYTVNVYEMDVDGNYPTAPAVVPDTIGEVGAEVTYTPAINDGFYLDTAKSTADLKTTVTTDDADVIDVYLARNAQTVKYVDENGDAIEGLTDAKYYYGKTYNVAAEISKAGYDWAGWKSGDATVTAGTEVTANPAADGEVVTYQAAYTAAANTVTIQGIYKDAMLGGEVELEPYTVNTTTGYTVKVVDEVPAEPEANVTYVLKSALPTATHYQIPAGEFEIAVADDGKAVLEITYEAKSYTYKFVDEDGSVIKEDTVPYYTNVEAPEGEDKPEVGKIFKNWVNGDDTLESYDTFDITGDVTYTADYTDEIFYVYYTVEGEWPEGFMQPEEAEIIYGDEVVLPVVAPVPGYTFSGWEVIGATENDEGKWIAGASDVDVTATWTHNEYTITFYLDETSDEPYSSDILYYGDPIEAPTPAQSEILGQKFLGWTYEDEDGVDLGDLTTMPEKNVIAYLSAEPYVVTFYDVYGADSRDFSKATITAEDAAAAEEALVNEIKEIDEIEFTFVEWRDADGKAVTFPFDVTANVEIYPYATVKISFYEDYDKEGNPTGLYREYTKDFGYAYTDYETDFADLGTPTKTGYSFAGWDVYLGGEAYTNETVVATWDVEKYQLSFTIDGEVVDGYPVETAYGTVITAPDAGKKAGYTFSGWNGIPADGKMPACDLTVTGSWVADGNTAYTIETYTMDTNGAYGEPEVETKTAATGAVITHTPDAAGEGLYIDEDKCVLETTVSAGTDDVIKVYYARNAYTVTVDGVEQDAKVYHGATFTAPSTSTAVPEGYTLTGWNNGTYAIDEEITVTEALVLTADKAANTDTEYTVEIYTMDINGGYGEPEVKTEKGTTDAEVTYEPDAAGEGLYLDEDASELTVTVSVGTDDVVKVYYARNAYTVTVDGVEQDAKVYHGATFTAPSTSTAVPEGYTLTGWNNGTYAIDEEITVTEALVLTADKAANTDTEYTVEIYTMDINGSYGEPEVKTEKGTTDAEVTYEPAAAGEGLYLDEDASELTVTVSVGTDDVVKVYYARNKYTVTVDGVAQDAQVYHGATFTAPAAPEVGEGLEFAGWSDGKTVYQADEEITVTGALDLVKTTTANEYEVVFKINNNIYASSKAAFGAAVADPGTPGVDVIPAGYTFMGWSEDGETVLEDLGTVKAGGNIYLAVLKANEDTPYEIVKYFQTVDGQGWGDAQVTPKTGTTGELASVDYEAEAVEGFRIDETISKNNVEITGDGNAKVIIYYLRNTVKVTVNGETKDYFYGAEVAEPEAPVKEGYTFADAWTYEDGTTATFPIEVKENITLVPVFTVNKYNITFVDGTTTLEGPTEVEYGSTIVAPTAPDKTSEGLVFGGWLDADTGAAMPEKMPAKDATYKANYVQNGAPVKYTIEVYQMNLAGNYELTAKTTASALVGTTQTVEAGEVTGFTFSDADSVLSATILADGSTTLKVCYARNKYTVTFGANAPVEVYYGATIPVAEDPDAATGMVFAGWSPEVPAAMPAENLVFEATWAVAEYTITYVINGEAKAPITYAYGADVDTPETPSVSGMKFVKWTPEVPETMPAENLIIVAEFEASVYNVTFRNADGTVFDKKAVQFGDEITLPTAEPTLENYTFEGWSGVPADGLMPDHDLEVTPIFERVKVMLVPKDGSTTVIDRDGLTVDDYADGESAWYVYGLEEILKESTLREKFIDVTGDGRIEIVYRELSNGKTHAPYTGTGTVINVYDNVTDELVESFTIIIFGDLNGDSYIKAIDASIAEDEVLMNTDWSDEYSENYKEYMLLAADFDKNGVIKAADTANIENTALGISVIDQTDGSVIEL